MSSRKSEILHFDGFLLSKSYKGSTEKIEKSDLSWQWRVMQSLKKNWLVVSNMTWEIWWMFTQPLKSLKISFRWALFVQSYRGVILHDTEQWCKIWINGDFVVSKKGWRTGWTFIRAFKRLKNCTLMGSFYPKFQLESFIRIMCYDTEVWCKI